MEPALALVVLLAGGLLSAPAPAGRDAAATVHLLRSLTGSGGSLSVGVSCSSWRLGVETNNLRGWSTVPAACEGYVGHYMLGGRYRQDSLVVADAAAEYAAGLRLAGDGKNAWVFDIDETSLSNLPYYARHGFGAEPLNATSFVAWMVEGVAPALPESLKLYKKLVSLGFKVIFLTGRYEDMRMITRLNLKKAGYQKWEKLILRGPKEVKLSAYEYKSSQRQKLEAQGYRILGNIGDQWSDILGPAEGNRTFKLPNPMYYIS